MKDNKINIGEYFKQNTQFEVPKYQRGFKWGAKPEVGKSSVEFFCDSLIEAFNRNDKEYFIEAVTVVQENKNSAIILVDGQQRTTTIFLIMVVLEEFDFLNKITLKYDIREDSHRFLEYISKRKYHKVDDEDTQDIFFFKEALKTISKKVEELGEKKQSFVQFIKKNVFLLFNIIPSDKAVNTFIALNGLKAVMKDEELIKSDLLIKSSRIVYYENHQSLDLRTQFGIDWKINENRGKLARNWDKWLYWWNQKNVREYFGVGDQHPLYYLLVTYWNLNKPQNATEFNYENFKNIFIADYISAKLHFEGIRKLQKTFEDLYNHYYSHNFLGIITKGLAGKEKETALQYFLNPSIEDRCSIEEYSKWSLVFATHLEIINNTKEKVEGAENEILIKERKVKEAIELLNQKYVYWDETNNEFKDRRKEFAYRFLMLLNLLEDNKLKRKFDYSIWDSRSLEHIYPKSKYRELDFLQVGFEEGSIHCIGNLVLLYGKNNSEFGSKDVENKKKVYFDTGSNKGFKSRNLLHTLSVFAEGDWKEKEIVKNKKQTIKTLKQYYGVSD